MLLFKIILFCFVAAAFSDELLHGDDLRIKHNQQNVKNEDVELSNNVRKVNEEHSKYDKLRVKASEYLDTLESVKKDWIDPNDMGIIIDKGKFKVTEVKESVTTKPDVLASSSPPPQVALHDTTPVKMNAENPSTFSLDASIVPKQESCVLDNVYISRWLKKLILRIEKESDMEYSAIKFTLDSNILANLKELSVAKTFEAAMLDETLSNLLAQAVITRKESYLMRLKSHSDVFWSLIYGLGIGLCVYALYCSFRRRPLLTLLGCCFVISVGWHWMHLYQQKKAHKHAELSSLQIPTQCKKHDLGLLEHFQEYLKSYFVTNECSKYYEALMVDPFWEVSLSVAVSEAVTATLFQPLFASSRAFNFFIKQLFDGLPFYLTVILVLFIFFVTIIKFNYAIRLPFFMGFIEPCPPAVGSRVQELPTSRQPPELTNTSRTTPGLLSACVEAIQEEAFNTRTYSSGSSKQIESKPIECRKDPQMLKSNCVPLTSASKVTEKSISEVGLALKSGQFEVVEDSTGSRFESAAGINAGVETNSDDSTLVGEKSSKSNDTKTLLHSKDDLSLVKDGNQEVSNLPESLSDSFEVIPGPLAEESMSLSIAGPNCDTSGDLLQTMHAGCKFCKNNE